MSVSNRFSIDSIMQSSSNVPNFQPKMPHPPPLFPYPHPLFNLFSMQQERLLQDYKLPIRPMTVFPAYPTFPNTHYVKQVDKFSDETVMNARNSPDIDRLSLSPTSPSSKHSDNSLKSDQSADMSTKRNRTAFTDRQLLSLEAAFQREKYVNRLRRIEIARSLGLSEKQVKIWFQNRRVKYKKEEKLGDLDIDKPCTCLKKCSRKASTSSCEDFKIVCD